MDPNATSDFCNTARESEYFTPWDTLLPTDLSASRLSLLISRETLFDTLRRILNNRRPLPYRWSRDDSSSRPFANFSVARNAVRRSAPDSVPCSRSLESQPRVTSGSRSPTFRLTTLPHARPSPSVLARDHASPSSCYAARVSSPASRPPLIVSVGPRFVIQEYTSRGNDASRAIPPSEPLPKKYNEPTKRRHRTERNLKLLFLSPVSFGIVHIDKEFRLKVQCNNGVSQL